MRSPPARKRPAAADARRPRWKKGAFIHVPGGDDDDAAPIDQQDSDNDYEEKDVIICTICDKPVKADERRRRACRMHRKRGLAAKSAQGVAARSSEVCNNMGKLKANNPAKYKATVLSMVASGRRSAVKMAKFKSAIANVIRSDSTLRKEGGMFCNKLQYIAHRRYANGHTGKSALKTWAKDLADKSVFERKKGGQIIAAVPK
ncbi:unnamed protein product [Prorocentrum cordatum]|uniref:Uncharacterized protein n=1 Tax=Prorocentrum cordatum TaxID=2364126 RepID=A0ABN9T9T4_9DINO|nr:unnamed protein product [Polarella glacialis]